jgi:SAM-dependent methyltransferase
MSLRSRHDQRRLYRDLAWTWPIISRPEHYVGEAERFVGLARKHAQSKIKTLLDLGCGGGHNDWTLKKHLQVTGVDISEEMLLLATRLNPEVTYMRGDLRSVRLEQKFDAVVIADAITYMLTVEELRAAFATAYAHLHFGGVFSTYAELTPENWKQNHTECTVQCRDDLEIVLLENRYDPDVTDMSYEHVLVYLIRRKGVLRIETDRHLGGLFPLDTWRGLLGEAGFSLVEESRDDEGIPWFTCLKPGRPWR